MPTTNRATTAVLSVIGALIVVALVAGAFLVGRAQRSDRALDGQAPTERSASTTTEPQVSPGGTRRPSTTPSLPPATAGPPLDAATIEREVEELSRFVEQERGLTFKHKVQVQVVGDAEFRRLLFEDFDEEQAEIEKAAVAFEALGFVEPGTDLVAELKKLLELGVLGFYDPETDELVVRGGHLSPYVRQTIVHELTHALDDQWFDLDRPEYDDRRDEVAFGLSVVAEGNARRVERAYEDQMTLEEKAARDREEAELIPDMRLLASIPDILIYQISAPYEIGEPFIEELLERGGQPAVDKAFEDPPTTSEQTLDVDRYLAREPAEPPPTPPAAGAVVDEGTFGVLMTILLLSDAGLSGDGRDASEGWGGDSYVLWRTAGGAACARIDWAMDTALDANELERLLVTWAASKPNAEVESLNATTVRLTSCSR